MVDLMKAESLEPTLSVKSGSCLLKTTLVGGSRESGG